MPIWSPDSFRAYVDAQPIDYEPGALETAVAKLRALPPLVTSWEVERLKALLAEAQIGRRFVLQGGDCAETFEACSPSAITSKLKILLQMSLVLVQGSKLPVVRVGRFAGQYAKPRSRPTEVRGDVELPSYFGDLVNRAPFTADARRPDPDLLIAGYQHAAMTLNFVRSLTDRGFSDLHHPENWDLSFFERADLPTELREEYQRSSAQLAEALRFMEALGERAIDDLTRVEFFTCHEGLNLHYESAQTRTVPRRPGYYDLTTHLPWIGERTRAITGAHVAFFRGIRNPVGVKLGPSVSAAEALELALALNPDDEPGKLVLISRMGAEQVARTLPPVVAALKGRRVLWVCDPMHGNTTVTSSGIKTRDFDAILAEVEQTFEVHDALGTCLGGVHFELTGDDVTECIGGGVTSADLDRNYASACDPRLNYRQALEMAFRLAARMRKARSSSRPPRPLRSSPA